MALMLLKVLLVLVEVVSAFLLVGVILIQRTRSQGMGLAFGAGVGETLFGAGVGNVLTKATVVLAVVFLVNTTVLGFLQTKGRTVETSVTDRIKAPAPVMPAAPLAPQPGTPAPDAGVAIPDAAPAAAVEPVAVPPAPSADATPAVPPAAPAPATP